MAQVPPDPVPTGPDHMNHHVLINDAVTELNDTQYTLSLTSSSLNNTINTLNNHLTLAIDAHDASAISTAGVWNGNLAGAAANVEAALAVIDDLVISNSTIASEVTVVSAGFNGNLASTDDTVQKVAQKVDDLPKFTVGTVQPSNPVTNDVWIDTNVAL